MSSMPPPNSPESAMRAPRRRYLIVFVGLMWLMDLLAFPAVASASLITRLPPDLFIVSMYAVLGGQLALVILLAGLLGRHWLYGLCIACGLAAIGMQLLFLGQHLQYFMGVFQNANWAIATLPLVLLSAALPFYALRYLKGWRLARVSHVPASSAEASPDESGIRDMFAATAVIASTLFLARVPQVAWELRTTDYWQATGAILLGLCSASLLVVLPGCLAGFAQGSPSRLRTFRACYVIAFLLAAGGLTWLVNGSVLSVSSVVTLLLFVGIFNLIFFMGQAALLKSGFQLLGGQAHLEPARLANPTEPPSIPEAVETARANRENQRRFASRVRTLVSGPGLAATALVVSAVIGSAVLASLESWRRTMDSNHNSLARDLQAQGGELEVIQRRLASVSLGPQATDADLLEFLPYKNDLRSLSLANSLITDAAIDTVLKFKSLVALDLSHTEVSSAVLAELAKMPNLSELDLAGTSIRADELALFMDQHPLRVLDLSHMPQVSQEELLNFKLHPRLEELGIAGYQLTDDEVSLLLSGSNIGVLDLSQNLITGHLLAQPGSLREITLNGNPVNDTSLALGLKTLPTPVHKLVLADTQLTNTALATLAASGFDSLEFGRGNITEAGLASSQLGVRQLALTDKQFTGACFEHWNPNCRRLSMRGSGLTDETVQHLENLSVSYLDLSFTPITDQALKPLSQLLYPSILDISHTHITADGLLDGDLGHFSRVIVGFGQYSDEQVQQISRVINLDLGGQGEANR